jgi:hypothetical protein
MLEFAVCGIMFTAFVMALLVLGLWIYNVSHVSQAARIAAHNIALTGNAAESRHAALTYLDRTLVACPVRNVSAYSYQEAGCGVAEAEMHPFFPGVQKLANPGGTAGSGRIYIRKEAVTVLEYRFRPGSRQYFNK